MRVKVMVAVIFIGLLLAVNADAKAKEDFYKRATQFAAKGQVDFAFMNYRKILRLYEPDALEKLDALFASGEYYYLRSDRKSSVKLFLEFIDVTENLDAKLFAYVYLYKISILSKDKKLKDKTIKDIIELKRNSYIFEEEKIYEYISPLNRQHKAVYTVSEIKFYVEDYLFEEIPFL